MPIRLTIVLVMLALGGAGCAAGTADSSDPTEAPSESPPTASASSTPSTSLTPASEQPSPEEPIDGERLTGTLGADTVEGGCGYLQDEAGTRYEVLYPDGWQLTLTPLELRDPDGTVVARGGDEVTVIGEEATDMASICQIGPIFRATAVEP